MTVDKCPICNEQHVLGRTPPIQGDLQTVSDLCNGCDETRFFLDDEREIDYRKEVKARVEKLESLFKEDYDDTLHRGMVEYSNLTD